MQMIVSICRPVDLLPHFFRHYGGIGFDKFYVAIGDGQKNPAFDRIMADCEPFDCIIKDGVQGWFTGKADSEIHNSIRQMHISPTDWYGISDLDEFSDIPCIWMRQALDHCDARNIKAITGKFVDRVTMDGSIPKITDEPIEKQFPIGCNLTKNVALSCDEKVFMAKGDVPITSGHHSAQCATIQLAVVNHYKWHGDIMNKLRWRSLVYRETGSGWWLESQRFYEFISRNGGRIDVADARLNSRLLST